MDRKFRIGIIGCGGIAPGAYGIFAELMMDKTEKIK